MITLLAGDCREALTSMAAESVHLCVTSPPYWGLRDYGLEPVVWGGGVGCAHVWGDDTVQHTSNNNGLGQSTLTSGSSPEKRQAWHDGKSGNSSSAFCQHCPAWRGSLGLEPTPDCAGWATGTPCGQCYICHMLEVFKGVGRVLRPEGVCWVNMGDNYAANSGRVNAKGTLETKEGSPGHVPNAWNGRNITPMKHPFKPKDLCGLPWRLAFALQAAGWYLRSAPPWVKSNPMPESATDRPGTGHEMWFMLTKQARYYWDGEAVKKRYSHDYSKKKDFGGFAHKARLKSVQALQSHAPSLQDAHLPTDGRNLRTGDFFHQGLTDQIAATEAYLAHLKAIQAHGGLLQAEDGTPAALVFNTQAYKAAHFATFSAAMIRPLIQGGTSERGCCVGCGAPWRREVERKPYTPAIVPIGQRHVDSSRGDKTRKLNGKSQEWKDSACSITTGWHPTCPCPSADPVPCTVLDIFGGSGTVGAVADQLGRHAILCEAQADYVALAQARLTDATPLLTQVETVAVSPQQQALW